MLEYLTQNRDWIYWVAGGSVVSLLLVLLLLPVAVLRLPADYFVRQPRIGSGPSGWLDWLWHIGKNLLGLVFVLAGILMLVLPGQGLLTILVGLLMLDLPRKRAVERRIIARPAILGFVNRLRARRGREPLRVGGEQNSATRQPDAPPTQPDGDATDR